MMTRKKKDTIVLIIAVVMVCSIIVSMYYSYRAIYEFSVQNVEGKNKLLADSVNECVMNYMIRPMTVSETHSHEEALINLMHRSGSMDPNYYESVMVTYLNTISTAFDYTSVFAVCANTKAYYTSKGFHKYIDPRKDSHDLWYDNFLAAGREQDLDVDTNQNLNNELCIFVNTAVYGPDGEFEGVCGVVMEISKLQESLRQFEERYGVKIAIVNENGLVQVSTDTSDIEQMILPLSDIQQLASNEYRYEKIDNKYVLTRFMESLNWYLILMADTKSNLDFHSLVAPSIVILVIGFLAMIIVLVAFYRKSEELMKSTLVSQQQLEVLVSLSNIYLTMHLINLKNDSIVEYATVEPITAFLIPDDSAAKQMNTVINHVVSESWRHSVLHFADLTTLRSRMGTSNLLTMEFQANSFGWIRAQFILNSLDEEGLPETVVFTTQRIEEEKVREEQLIKTSSTDELTGLKNRRAYDEDINRWNIAIPPDLVVISMDVNGLKQANDTDGHIAGDELLVSVSGCMRRAFSGDGHVYRTGGDEFVAIIRASKQHTEELVETFHRYVRNWKGTYISAPSVSCGVVFASEFKGKRVEELIKIADKRMYSEKAEHYKQSGFDRRSVRRPEESK